MIKLTLSKSEEALTLPLHYKDFTRSMVYAILPPEVSDKTHGKTGRTGITVSDAVQRGHRLKDGRLFFVEGDVTFLINGDPVLLQCILDNARTEFDGYRVKMEPVGAYPQGGLLQTVSPVVLRYRDRDGKKKTLTPDSGNDMLKSILQKSISGLVGRDITVNLGPKPKWRSTKHCGSSVYAVDFYMEHDMTQEELDKVYAYGTGSFCSAGFGMLLPVNFMKAIKATLNKWK